MKLTSEEIRVRKNQRSKAWYEQNKERHKATVTKYWKDNESYREKRRVSAREYQRKKYELINEVKRLCNVYEAFL